MLFRKRDFKQRTFIVNLFIRIYIIDYQFVRLKNWRQRLIY